MKGKLRLALCGFVIVVLLLGVSPVLAAPVMPHAFYGTVTINGADADADTVVTAKVGGVDCGSYTVEVVGQYGSLDERDYLIVQGDISNGDSITFYVNGDEAEETATFEAGGGPTEQDLSVTITEPAAGGGAPLYSLETDLFGVGKTFYTSCTGEVLRTVEATSEDGMLTINIPKGTFALGEDGKRLKELEAAVDKSPPDPPEDANVIGLAYDFGPDGATFDPPITFTWSYDPDALPDDVAEDDLVLAYYDEATGEWLELDCVVDTKNNTITALVDHFTTFAVIAVTPPPAPEPAPPPVVVAPAPPAPPAPTPPVVPEPVVPPPTPEVEAPFNWPVFGGAIVALVIVALLSFFWVKRRRQD